MSLINCGVNLILSSCEDCVTVGTATPDADPNANRPVPEIRAQTDATLAITDAKLYAPVVILSTQNDNKLLQQLKTGFKCTIKCNKYR